MGWNEAGRTRRPGGPGTALYWAAGTGAGSAWSAGVRGAAIPALTEIGVRTGPAAIVVSAGIRERARLIIGGGSPPLDFANSVQLVFTLTAGDPGGR